MKCKICNETTHPILDTQFSTHYYHCEQCHFIQMDLNKRVSFIEERELYDTHENSLDDKKYVAYFKKFLNLGVFPFKKEGQLLDYGSGPEPVLVQLIDRDYNFTTQHYDLHYYPNNLYQEDTYDVIVSTEVIEHVPDPVDFMTHLCKHLKPNGIISIMTLFHYNDINLFMKWWYRRDETHISFFDLKTLETLAKLCGLEVIYTDNKRITTFRKAKV